jgi:hypothetical protein
MLGIIWGQSPNPSYSDHCLRLLSRAANCELATSTTATTALIQEIEVPSRHHIQPASNNYTSPRSVYGSGITLVTSHHVLTLTSLLSWQLLCYARQEYVSAH